MNAWEQILAAYFLNACWQLPMAVLLGIALLRLARTVPARIEYWVWLGAGLIGLLAPAGVILGLYVPGRSGEPGAAPVPSRFMHIALAAVAACAIYQIVHLARGAFAWRKLKRSGIPHPGASAAVQMAHNAGVQVLLSPPGLDPAGPVLLGLRRPLILLPRFLVEPGNEQLLQATLWHELAHVERRDQFALLLSEIILAPLAFHPTAYWLRRKLAETRELACDERVARDRVEASAYARCLLEVARNVLRPTAIPQALGILDGRNLERRIRTLVRMHTGSAVRFSRRHQAILLAVALTIVAALSTPARSLYLWIARVPALPTVQLHVAPPPPPPPPDSIRH